MKLFGCSREGLDIYYYWRSTGCGLWERERGTSGECDDSRLLRKGVIYVKALLVLGDTAGLGCKCMACSYIWSYSLI